MKQWRTPGQWDKGPEQYYDSPPPEIAFAGETFVLTGVFALGDRPAIEAQICHLGGKVSRKPLKGGSTVVIGALPTLEWGRSDAGRKILQALELREQGHFVSIVSEDVFAKALGDAYTTTPLPISFQYNQRNPEKLFRMWLAPLEEEFATPLVIGAGRGGFVAYPEGKKAQWICRFLTMKMLIEPRDKGKIPVLYLKRLPEEAVHALRALFAEHLAQQSKEKAPKERLPPEELQRRNTERKAAMRAKPVTQEVLNAADEIISALTPHLPEGARLEAYDRAKYYAIALTPSCWLCRLHYKTKNKYIEINGENPELVQTFSYDAALIKKIITRINAVLKSAPNQCST